MLARRLAIAILFVAVCVPIAEAGPIHYTITFAGGPILPASGSFNYDPVSPQFTDFLVVWHGATFDLTPSANSPSIAGYHMDEVLPGLGARATFEMLSGFPSTLGDAWNVAWDGAWADSYGVGKFSFNAWRAVEWDNQRIDVGADYGRWPDPVTYGTIGRAGGSWSIDAQGVPDPGSTLLLFGTGLVGLRAWRKRRQ
jgi:hypothetical protein